ncbi:diaminopimelate epimerase [Actinokineospora sp. G85]|uniref:diaminopimelate epimerase n=1 Tax=Actinokineospora sp. G85 TaxID=3406626 RepID=UPI003C731DD8
MGIRFSKGHGTENDFVVLPDPDGELDLTPARVRALCDRRRGLGADGVLRVVRTKALPDAPEGIDGDVWFMDYRNADGSIAEMCGNGVRVFARYLTDNGMADGPEVGVGTRAGLRPATVHPDGQVTVDMGPVRRTGHSTARVSGRDYPGLGIDVGNPHLACVTGGVADLDLGTQPGFDPALFPNGVNVEFVEPLGGGEVRMRVHERGVGETRSCGTGTVAAAAAALEADGAATGTRVVHIPGGAVTVEITQVGSTLTGPVVFVADGGLSRDWWDGLE